jgi:hypothetical protein
MKWMSLYMNEQEAEDWKEELDLELQRTDKTDLIIPQSQVARAFPSSDPHPRTFDHPMIDEVALKKWASERGWRVDMAPESVPQDSDSLPPVRFRKQS